MKLAAALIVGLVIGFVLGNVYTYQDILGARTSDTSERGSGNAALVSTTTPSDVGTSEPAMVIHLSELSPSQRALAEKVGIQGEEIVVTTQMLACAEERLGAERVADIIKGAEPSTLELFKLAPCF